MHLVVDIVRNSILITGLVIVMMMMIESMNIKSKGKFFKGLRKTPTGQVILGALLGSIPGCMGGFATVSLYTHRMFSFGALVAMMIASSGDEAFIMLAMIPEQAMILFAVLFVIAVLAGIIIDKIHLKVHVSRCDKHDHEDCGVQTDCEGYEVHEHEGHEAHEHEGSKRHFGWKRIVMFIGLAVFIAARATGNLSHDHSAHAHEHEHSHAHAHNNDIECHCEHHEHNEHISSNCHSSACAPATSSMIDQAERVEKSINLLDEEWMNVLFAGLSVIVLFVLLFASDHFIEEHLWNHVIKKHLLTIFGWTFGVLLVLGIALQYIDIDHWISDNTALMILLATLIGIIPESGPHLIFVTLFAAGVVPFPVLLASSISQDGHASIPLLAESKKSFAWAKLINCVVALAAGYAAMLLVN